VHQGRGVRVHCPFTHAEIGEHVGASRETVTRTIHDFKTAGLLEQRGAILIIPDFQALAVYAGIDLNTIPGPAGS
jgi:CRP-like cAMP-binding protein